MILRPYLRALEPNRVKFWDVNRADVPPWPRLLGNTILEYILCVLPKNRVLHGRLLSLQPRISRRRCTGHEFAMSAALRVGSIEVKCKVFFGLLFQLVVADVNWYMAEFMSIYARTIIENLSFLHSMKWQNFLMNIQVFI